MHSDHILPYDLKNAYFLMEMYPDMAYEQYEIFKEAWTIVKKKLNMISELEGWFPSDRSYYSVAPCKYTDLIDKYGVLGIPPYVYESDNDDFTIISCLGEVQKLKRNFTKTMYHVTTLSNFSGGYDKYSGRYCKLPKNTFPDKFHLLHKGEIEIGLKKHKNFLAKLLLMATNRLLFKLKLMIHYFQLKRLDLLITFVI